MYAVGVCMYIKLHTCNALVCVLGYWVDIIVMSPILKKWIWASTLLKKIACILAGLELNCCGEISHCIWRRQIGVYAPQITIGVG